MSFSKQRFLGQGVQSIQTSCSVMAFSKMVLFRKQKIQTQALTHPEKPVFLGQGVQSIQTSCSVMTFSKTVLFRKQKIQTQALTHPEKPKTAVPMLRNGCEQAIVDKPLTKHSAPWPKAKTVCKLFICSPTTKD